VFNKFQTYKASTKTHKWNKIICLRSDNGGEYLSHNSMHSMSNLELQESSQIHIHPKT
jgi:hypothetical protein